MASVIEWPKEVVPSSMNWQLVSNSKTFVSTFTGSAQTVRYPGSRWRCSLTFNNLTETKSRELEALTAELDGESGRVKISHWIRQGLVERGVPAIRTANQTGRILLTEAGKKFNCHQKRDYLTIGDELKIVTDNVFSDTNGNASIPISPMLRYAPKVNDKLETLSPFGILN
ncbi:hypothetical protein [Arsenophonus nasoniae]|uniref:Uncharacterized protein n=1 Tax=Arsenophonus nasoniae TaxID=638 RepID=A0A4P7KS98_9GAMM|nr:hypothetical protein [Arsenophonus nasoniae]QBY42811.1 hypothetical protein ArsFIN_13710 [Arsenophonus nasoniae]